MKNLFFITLFAGLAFTSCEKETNYDLNDQTTNAADLERIEILEEPDDLFLPNIDDSTGEIIDDGIAAKNGLGSWSNIVLDNFNANSNIFTNWEVGANGRNDYNSINRTFYNKDNASLQKLDNRNCLRLTAWKTGNDKYQSGHVKSKNKFHPNNNEDIYMASYIKLISENGAGYKGFSQTYGAWPAFWSANEADWPKYGEIDMMEGYSRNGSADFGRNLFYGPRSIEEGGSDELKNRVMKEYDVSEGWHKYSCIWRKRNNVTQVHIYLDNKWLGAYSDKSDSQGKLKLNNFKNHQLILNMNIGSNSDLGIFNNNNIKIYDNVNMFVDWATVKRRKNNL